MEASKQGKEPGSIEQSLALFGAALDYLQKLFLPNHFERRIWKKIKIKKNKKNKNNVTDIYVNDTRNLVCFVAKPLIYTRLMLCICLPWYPAQANNLAKCLFVDFNGQGLLQSPTHDQGGTINQLDEVAGRKSLLCNIMLWSLSPNGAGLHGNVRMLQ